MLARLWLAAIMILAASFAATASAPAKPAPSPRIVAIGDLHGDFAAWRAIAAAAGLIDARGRWIGRDAILVQTGDVVDRGPNSLGIIRDLMRLQREAVRAGGRVVALVGNHEAMNVTDDLRYVPASDFAAFANADSENLRNRTYSANRSAIEFAYRTRDPNISADAIRRAWLAATPPGKIERQAAWHPRGTIGRWIMSNPAVVMLADTLFVHGGISSAYAGVPIDEINRRVAAALAARETSEESIINDNLGPLWYRGLVARDEAPQTQPAGPRPSIEEELAEVLKAYGAKRIVVGHTPILSGVAVTQDGRLVRIDTGISAYYRGALSYLEIVGGTLIPHAVARPGP